MKIKNSDIEMKLIYKIAWSFHNTTGIDLEELIGEASIAYCEALHQWDGKHSKASTYAYTIMNNRLINFIQKKKIQTQSLDLFMEKNAEHLYHPTLYETNCFDEEELSYTNLIKNWTDDCKEIIEIIFYTPIKFSTMSPKQARGRLVKILRNKGWSWPRIWSALKEIKINLNKQ